MKVIVIGVGSELTMGIVRDENACFISKGLLDLGIGVSKIVFVKDVEEEIGETLSRYLHEYDLIFVMGGLGLTSDDITKKIVARVTRRSLTLREDVLSDLRKRFDNVHHKKNLDMHNIEKLALLPQGASILKNPVGFACGFALDIDGHHLIVMPGVPSEVRCLFKESVIPYVKKTISKRRLFDYTAFVKIRTWGIREIEVEKILDNTLKEISAQISFSILPVPEGVDICLYSNGNIKLSKRVIKVTENTLKSKLHPYFYATGETKMEEVVAQILMKEGISLATAESCTGGLLAHRLTNIPGSSNYFLGGFVSYSDQAKCEYLRVCRDAIANYGAVSSHIAVEMAEKVREITGADIGLAITGYAGPAGGDKKTPVGTVFVGFSSKTDTLYEEKVFTGSRGDIKFKASQHALNMLRIHLLSK